MLDNISSQNILGNVLIWSLGFGLGLILGFIIPPPFGDGLAVLMFGSALIFMQSYLMPGEIEFENWAKYTSIAFILGIIISFPPIMLVNQFLKLSISHIFALPTTLLFVVIGQAWLLKQKFNNDIAYLWSIQSMFGILLGLLLLFLLGQQIPLELDQLVNREVDFLAAINWALMGLILGACYGSFTSNSLIQMRDHIDNTA